jgi:hypothetical protein
MLSVSLGTAQSMPGRPVMKYVDIESFLTLDRLATWDEACCGALFLSQDAFELAGEQSYA